ncbi:MAG TPA: shikimate dehydrogenase [Gammaproteobacteria bacterium]|nr:shikimate dehydrogenase [Gammaproteobacteria bacterium]
MPTTAPWQLPAGVDCYAVVGNPVAHSKSPRIHQAFAKQTGQSLVYLAQAIEPGDFVAAVAEFQRLGGKGLNVTLPFKLEAHALCARRSERAEQSGAVNTLWFERDGRICGDNTDGIGLMRDLTMNHGMAVAGRKVLLLGAGGAAQGILPALLAERPAKLTIANRTFSRARALAGRVPLAERGMIDVLPMEALAGRAFNLIINATAASLAGELPPLPDDVLHRGGDCYDMMYADEPTVFMQWGLRYGAARSVDGLGMLVEQAAESFYLWRGIRPDTAAVIKELRQS